MKSHNFEIGDLVSWKFGERRKFKDGNIIFDKRPKNIGVITELFDNGSVRMYHIEKDSYITVTTINLRLLKDVVSNQ